MPLAPVQIEATNTKDAINVAVDRTPEEYDPPFPQPRNEKIIG